MTYDLATDFLIRRSDLRETRVRSRQLPSLGRGDIVLEPESFGLTANNISFAVAGDSLGYWDFFSDCPTWGRLPVWSIARVAQSHCDEIEVGERVYGLMPMSSHVVVPVHEVCPLTFGDGAPHRRAYARMFTQYWRLKAHPFLEAEQEPQWLSFWPLFTMAYRLAQRLRAKAFFGAKTVVITSASSKAAQALEFFLSAEDLRIVGATSPANRSFVEERGRFDQVVRYDGLDELLQEPTVLIDLAGNYTVIDTIYENLGEQLRRSVLTGCAHWQKFHDLEIDTRGGPAPYTFFAPEHLGDYVDRDPRFLNELGCAWNGFMRQLHGWFHVLAEHAVIDLDDAYQRVLRGAVPPCCGVVYSH